MSTLTPFSVILSSEERGRHLQRQLCELGHLEQPDRPLEGPSPTGVTQELGRSFNGYAMAFDPGFLNKDKQINR